MKKLVHLAVSIAWVTALVACGANSTGNEGARFEGVPTYMVGGNVIGLDASEDVSLVLDADATNALKVRGSNTFTFKQAVAGNATYAVAVSTSPAGKTCSVVNGTGAGVAANISNVSVICSSNSYQIGGTVSGLASQPVVLVLNGDTANAATVSSNGGFTFSQSVAYNGSYTVTVGTQPAGTTCSVSNGTGSSVAADITNISVLCTGNTYTVSGTVSGLGAQTTLLLNGDTTHPVVQTSDGSFSFSQSVAHGASYTVSVSAQPTDLKYCQVTNATGTATSAVSNVNVSCVADWVATEIANASTPFPADSVLDSTNAATGVIRMIGTSEIKNGYVDSAGNYYFNNLTIPNIVYKIGSNGALSSFLLPNTTSVGGITGDSNGTLYFIDSSYIYKVESSGLITRVCSASFSIPIPAFSLSLDTTQNPAMFYLTSPGFVSKFNSITCELTRLNTLPGSLISVLAQNPNSGEIYLTTTRTSNLYLVNKLTTGIINTNKTVPSLPSGLVFDASGNMYMSISSSTTALQAMAPSGVVVTLAKGVSLSTAGDQAGIGRNANGDIYMTLKISQKVIKFSRPLIIN